jgi:peroxiredoxin
MPGLQKLHDKYKTRGVKVFGVNVWEESNAATYMEQRKFKYGLLLNGEDVAKTYQVSSLPTLYIIGGDGEIIYRTAITNEEEGETVLEQYLEKLETKSKP